MYPPASLGTCCTRAELVSTRTLTTGKEGGDCTETEGAAEGVLKHGFVRGQYIELWPQGLVGLGPRGTERLPSCPSVQSVGAVRSISNSKLYAHKIAFFDMIIPETRRV